MEAQEQAKKEKEKEKEVAEATPDYAAALMSPAVSKVTYKLLCFASQKSFMVKQFWYQYCLLPGWIVFPRKVKKCDKMYNKLNNWKNGEEWTETWKILV